MANKSLFSSSHSSSALTTNNAGGNAYMLSDKQALVQYAMTGCFNGTYYSSAEEQLDTVLKLANKVPTEFLAKLAVFSRQKGVMKDMPAFLAAIVAKNDVKLLTRIFSKVVDNPKMLRNFVQVLRSGVTGRKSLGSRPKKLVQDFLNRLSDEALFKADVGNNPSLPDIIKMVHPKPSSEERSNLYSYILDKEFDESKLPKVVQEFEQFKRTKQGDPPNVPFQMLTCLNLSSDNWSTICKNATWNQLMMNLNAFMRHGVFKDSKMVAYVAKRLSSEDEVKKSKVFPYQVFAAFANSDPNMPTKITNALQDAVQISLSNIPTFNGNVYVMLDVSGSMVSSITGNRGSVKSKVRCIDAAALIASAILRKNPEAVVIPFDTKVHDSYLNPYDSVMTNAIKLLKFGGGGTDCHLPLETLNNKKLKADLIIYLSDNESWMDPKHHGKTAMKNEWDILKANNPNCKLICCDFVPNKTTQVQNDENVLNLGGFNDAYFQIIERFIESSNPDSWVKEVEATQI